jgi:hypothetical protein
MLTKKIEDSAKTVVGLAIDNFEYKFMFLVSCDVK